MTVEEANNLLENAVQKNRLVDAVKALHCGAIPTQAQLTAASKKINLQMVLILVRNGAMPKPEDRDLITQQLRSVDRSFTPSWDKVSTQKPPVIETNQQPKGLRQSSNESVNKVKVR